MIKIESITIKEFRGIRDLTINLCGQNYAVCGPNGTGKSGIVDALEFGLTGNISRLTGKGRGNLSVKQHGPHVNSQAHPEKAIVTLEVSIPSLGKKATIIRNVKSPRAPVINPDEPAIRAAFEHVARHPEFTLTRREILKYVLAEPTDRAKEVQALLQLDTLETTRTLLKKIRRMSESEVLPLENSKKNAGESLMRALGIAELTTPTLLAAVNAKRVELDLAPLSEIGPTTPIRDGLESLSAAAPVKVPKAQAREDIGAARTVLDNLSSTAMQENRARALADLNKLKDNESNLEGVTRDAMLASALDLFDEKQCPVCQTVWEPEKFRAIVEAQRKLLVDAAKQRREAEQMLVPLINDLQTAAQLLAPLCAHARNLPKPIDSQPLVALSSEITRRVKAALAFLPLAETIIALDRELAEMQAAQDMLTELSSAVAELPEPTSRDAARESLILGQERLELWRGAALKLDMARQKAITAKRIFTIYGNTCDPALEAIYKAVEAEFRTFYRKINGDDEQKFEAQMMPSLGKLGFEVDFYGKGFFPPGAYHSEGHQDGMGLCLYLALMKHLLGNRFTLALLDDVLMSIDAGHRREVCALLKTAFPDTQFVLTTHDKVWLHHMRSSKLVDRNNSIEFRKWHVDHGPTEWKDVDVWAEIDDLVAKSEIRAAAAQLRFYIEYIAAEWCERLGGRVEYRSDGKYEMSDLLSAAISAMNDLYGKAKGAANSWNNKDVEAELKTQHAAFKGAVAELEQWPINPAVHYNEWAANLQRGDFEPVVNAFKELERQFCCPGCGDPLYVLRAGKKNESLRCACAKVNFNLNSRQKAA